MPRRIPNSALATLNDKEWLSDMHVTQLFSIGWIAKHIGVTPATVKRALVNHGILTPSQQSLRQASLQRKYGVSNIGCITRDKALATMTQKWGGHFFANSGNRKLRNSIMLSKYGSTNVGGTAESISKQRETNLKRYGRVHANQNHISLETLNLLQNKDWLFEQHIIQQKSLLQISKEVGVNDTTLGTRLHDNGIETAFHKSSYDQTQLTEFIKTLSSTVEENVRTIIAPYELDIVCPDEKIAIEYCGLYWHTEQNGKGRYYHKTKWERCKAQGYRLFTIYSDEWLTKQDIVKSILRRAFCRDTSLRIHARQCNIVECNVDDLLTTNHIQGKKNGTVSYALQYGGKNVAGIVFKKYKEDWYLERYATSCRVPGGFTKLLEHFKKCNSPSKIITFADLRWSSGNLYDQCGFTRTNILKPDYEYVINNSRVHKFNFRHDRMSKNLKSYDNSLSESQNMALANIPKIWHCGLYRYEQLCLSE